ncbi:hypothetical protein ES703_120461 [subsurface metagenome]
MGRKKVNRTEEKKSFLFLMSKRGCGKALTTINSDSVDLEEFGRVALRLARKTEEKWIAPREVAKYLRDVRGRTIDENDGVFLAIRLQELHPKKFRRTFGKFVTYAGRDISMQKNDCV